MCGCSVMCVESGDVVCDVCGCSVMCVGIV